MSLLDKHRCAFEKFKILLYMGLKNGNMICRLVKVESWLFKGRLRDYMVGMPTCFCNTHKNGEKQKFELTFCDYAVAGDGRAVWRMDDGMVGGGMMDGSGGTGCCCCGLVSTC